MRTSLNLASALASFALGFTFVGCHSHDEDGHDHDNEVITTVNLTFTPSGGGTPVVASFNDPDGDGGNPPVITPVALPAGAYSLSIAFANALATPTVDITAEVRDEADEHQVFLLGTAVNGPASNQPAAPLVHTYADMDANGLPIGLVNGITAMAGTGTLTLVLRHLQPLNDKPVKVATLAEAVKAGGLATIGGASDVEVNFPVTVTP